MKGAIEENHSPVNKWQLIVPTAPPLTIVEQSGIEDELETTDLPDRTRASGAFALRRQRQEREWMRALVESSLRDRFFSHPRILALLPDLERAVMEGRLPAASAARALLEAYGEG